MGAGVQKLTDRQLTSLYLGLAQHYAECVEDKMSIPQMYNELFSSIDYTLNNDASTSPLKDLSAEEKTKVFSILNAFFHATPEYRNIPKNLKGKQFFNDGTLPPKVVIINQVRIQRCSYYRCNNDRLIDWLILDNIMNNSHRRGYYTSHYNRNHSYPSNTSNKHHNHRNSSSKGDNVFEKLVVVIVGTAILLGSFIAMMYILTQANDWIQRCVWNEGWMQATFALLGMAVAVGIATFLIETIAFSAIMAFIASAGFSNPAGLATLAIMGLGVIVGVGISYVIQEKLPKKSNVDAIDPLDPERYKLSDSEAANLVSLNIDPLKVKLAIVALRSEMGQSADPRSLFRWLSNEDKNDKALKNKVRHNLSVIRDLRFGKISVVQVGEMRFDCSMDALSKNEIPEAKNTVYLRNKEQTKSNTFFNVQPSAPPVEPPPYYNAPATYNEVEFQQNQYEYPIIIDAPAVERKYN